MNLRIVTKEDAASILRIYAPYVKNTAVTFEYDVPEEEEMRCRIENTLEEYPYLVAEEDGIIVGYAYAGRVYGREADKHCAEVSIYVDTNCRGNGIGSRLYQELERWLIKQNVFVVYACIAETERTEDEFLSDASIRFHEKTGYVTVGRHSLCGYKFDRWYSVIWMEKVIAERAETPDRFVPFPEIAKQEKGV